MDCLKKKREKNTCFFLKGKKAFEMNVMGMLFIALLVLAIILVAYGLFSERGAGMIDRIKNYFRFGFFVLGI